MGVQIVQTCLRGIIINKLLTHGPLRAFCCSQCSTHVRISKIDNGETKTRTNFDNRLFDYRLTSLHYMTDFAGCSSAWLQLADQHNALYKCMILTYLLNDAILALRLLTELHKAFDCPLNMVHLDIKAAFDSVNSAALWKALRSTGIQYICTGWPDSIYPS